MMEKPPGTADLERLETEIEEALISLIDRPTNELMLADLQRRKSHLIEVIERLRRQYPGNVGLAKLH